MSLFRLPLLLLALTLSVLTAPLARAEVILSFYSHEFGDRFPHAFVTLKGKWDATGDAVDLNYGFTATAVSPAVLMGSVKGYVQVKDAAYIAKSNRQFSVKLDDAGLRRVLAKVQEWQDRAQPSYNLGKRNCVHFVMEIAETVGLAVNRKSKYFKKPRSFLEEVKSLNPTLK